MYKTKIIQIHCSCRTSLLLINTDLMICNIAFKLYIVLASLEFPILIRLPEEGNNGVKYVVGKFCASTVSITVHVRLVL